MPAFLSRGFRPFFLGAAVLAIVSMAAWLAIYLFDRRYDATGMSPFLWHAHEMLFGYAMAVIGGFLLTAVWNWTGRKTAAGLPLAALFVCWAGARVAMFGSPGGLAWAMFLDTAFLLGLLFALARPVIAVRQIRQAPVLVILLWLVAARVAAGLGAMGEVPGGGRMGIYAALYGVLALVTFMGRRVLPFFIQRGVGYEVELRNDAWNDRATIALFPAFALSELLLPNHFLGALLAASTFGQSNDVYFKVGLLTTIGLTAKNAILIVQFARARVDEGARLTVATLEAAKLRLRPIIMTSLAFGFGVLPLFLASGAGAGAQRAIGTGVLGGMITSTILVTLFAPLFYVMIYKAMGKHRKRVTMKHTDEKDSGEAIS